MAVDLLIIEEMRRIQDVKSAIKLLLVDPLPYGINNTASYSACAQKLITYAHAL